MERTAAVYDTALRGFAHISETLLASLAPWMQTAVTLPARLCGRLKPGKPHNGNVWGSNS